MTQKKAKDSEKKNKRLRKRAKDSGKGTKDSEKGEIEGRTKDSEKAHKRLRKRGQQQKHRSALRALKKLERGTSILNEEKNGSFDFRPENLAINYQIIGHYT